jgi:hypothetical protein
LARIENKPIVSRNIEEQATEEDEDQAEAKRMPSKSSAISVPMRFWGFGVLFSAGQLGSGAATHNFAQVIVQNWWFHAS